jgi:hypothetical protein
MIRVVARAGAVVAAVVAPLGMAAAVHMTALHLTVERTAEVHVAAVHMT